MKRKFVSHIKSSGSEAYGGLMMRAGTLWLCAPCLLLSLEVGLFPCSWLCGRKTAVCLPGITSVLQVDRRKKGSEVSSEALPFNSGREDPTCLIILSLSRKELCPSLASRDTGKSRILAFLPQSSGKQGKRGLWMDFWYTTHSLLMVSYRPVEREQEVQCFIDGMNLWYRKITIYPAFLEIKNSCWYK